MEIINIKQTVPYQKCPVCEGMGQIFVNQLDPYNTSSSIGYRPCHVCGGSGIIPMHVLPCNEVKIGIVTNIEFTNV